MDPRFAQSVFLGMAQWFSVVLTWSMYSEGSGIPAKCTNNHADACAAHRSVMQKIDRL